MFSLSTATAIQTNPQMFLLPHKLWLQSLWPSFLKVWAATHVITRVWWITKINIQFSFWKNTRYEGIKRDGYKHISCPKRNKKNTLILSCHLPLGFPVYHFSKTFVTERQRIFYAAPQPCSISNPLQLLIPHYQHVSFINYYAYIISPFRRFVFLSL
jgi:hypothetical protein